MKKANELEQIPVLTALGVFFILGILMGSFINIPFLVLWGLGSIFLILAFLFRHGNLKFLLIFLLLSLVIGALQVRNYLYLPKNHISRINAYDFNPVRIQGIIDSDPTYGVRKTTFNFWVKQMIVEEGSQTIQGKVLVQVFNKQKFSYGDELILEGNLYRPFDYSKDSNFSYREYLKNKGIYYILNVKKKNEIVLINKDRGNPLKFLAFKISHNLQEIFDKYLLAKNSLVLGGVILGKRQSFPKDIRQLFVKTGTAHILAISGFHVGVVIFILLIFLKALRIKRKIRFGLIIPILIIYCIAVGGRPSVVRATIMAVIFLVGYLISQEVHIINSLSLAALIILAYSPMQLFDLGFKLSFLSVFSIVVLAPRIIRFFIRRKLPYLLRVMINGLSVSFSAWLATAGFIAYYFKIITPITILANLVIIPIISLIIILGFSLCLAGAVFPALATPIAATTNFTMAVLFKITTYLSHLPFAYFPL